MGVAGGVSRVVACYGLEALKGCIPITRYYIFRLSTAAIEAGRKRIDLL
jgi:hypothetical protein